MTPSPVAWSAIEADPRFQNLHRRKNRFLWSLMAFSLIYYFLLPLGSAYAPELFQRTLWGPLNVGLVFALSEFVVAWSVAIVYSWRANREFDVLAAEIRATYQGGRHD